MAAKAVLSTSEERMVAMARPLVSDELWVVAGAVDSEGGAAVPVSGAQEDR